MCSNILILFSERENLNENYLEKSNFWALTSGYGHTRSLPRPKRKVKFKDDPPERPPPPAPERQTTSFQVVISNISHSILHLTNT